MATAPPRRFAAQRKIGTRCGISACGAGKRSSVELDMTTALHMPARCSVCGPCAAAVARPDLGQQTRRLTAAETGMTDIDTDPERLGIATPLPQGHDDAALPAVQAVRVPDQGAAKSARDEFFKTQSKPLKAHRNPS